MAKALVTKGGYVSAAEAQARKLGKVNAKTYPADARTVARGTHPNAGTAQAGGARINGGAA